MPVVSLWVEGHHWSHANHRPHIEAIGGTVQVIHMIWVQARLWGGMAASSSGQARVGACEVDVWVCVKSVCKCTELEKKNEK